MGLITDPYDFVADTPAVADQVDERFTRLYDLVNGNLDSDNLGAASVERDRLAADALNAFLKLFTPADHKLAFGTGDNGGASWGGAADRVFDIPHGMGGTPGWWMAWGKRAVSDADSEDPTVVTMISADNTNLRVKQSTLYRGHCNFPGAVVYWVAIL